MGFVGVLLCFLVLLGLTALAHPFAQRTRLPFVVVLAIFAGSLGLFLKFSSWDFVAQLQEGLQDNPISSDVLFYSSGVIEVEREGETDKLGPGQAFGQLRVFDPSLNNSIVRAATHAHLFRLSVDKFHMHIKRNPKWRAAMTRHGASLKS